ncbi:MAG TPA: aminotransferase class I/II-fold pyridoxal phosphate-dependent enzyme [candidate division Zixibacteria bacterium]|nr:aminotransferase class I/II-fold pyridoxal phosphate-dependent enzyme [candidate division Zixibacteria bacterium]
MLPESGRLTAAHFQLKETIARKLAVNSDSIFLYQEFGSFLSGLFRGFSQSVSRIIVSAPYVPEIALSCDKADIELVESASNHFSENGFEELKNQVKSKNDIVYLSNPNRLTGASFSLAQIKSLAALVGEGLLIVDEYYHEFSRLSAISLLKSPNNLIILRTIENWGATQDSESGFAVVSEKISKNTECRFLADSMDRITAQKCLTTVLDAKSSVKDVEKIQTRSLLLAKELNQAGVKCRLTPTDFILLQISAGIDTGKMPADENIRLDQMDNSTEKESFYRYRVTSTDKDFRFVEVLSGLLKSPSQALRKSRIDTAAAALKGTAQIKPLIS